MSTTRTQYLYYEITLHSQSAEQEILQFKSRYPQCQVRNKFAAKEYLGFYPVYYEVVVQDDTPLKLAFLMLFPQARLKTIVNSISQLVALG